MKKILLAGAIALFHFAAQGQDFRYGIKGGANYSNINGKELDKNAHRNKLGTHVGAMLNIQYAGTKGFSLQPELIYSRKGYENYSLPHEVRDKNNQLLYSAQQGGLVRLNYLDLPIMLNYKTSILVLEAGPQVSFLVGVHNEAFLQQTLANGTQITTPVSRFDKTGIKKVDVGIAAGLRLETENGVGLGIRFNQGLIRLPSNATDVPHAPNGFNQYFQLFASYLLPI